MGAEVSPALAMRFAGLGLGAVVLSIALLAFTRDASVVVALEAAPSGTGRSTEPDAPTNRAEPTSTASAIVSVRPDVPRGKNADTSALARANTVEALRELRASYPTDPAVLSKLVRAEAAANQNAQALGTAKQLFELDPKAVDDKELQGLVVRGAQGAAGPAQDAAFGLMQGPMGATGVELLFDLSVNKSSPAAVRTKAVEATKREDTKKLASPATRVAIELRDHSGCDRKAYFAEAERVGDSRCLQFLTPLTSTSGCALLGLSDCYKCLGGRGELNQAIKAIKDRGSK